MYFTLMVDIYSTVHVHQPTIQIEHQADKHDLQARENKNRFSASKLTMVTTALLSNILVIIILLIQ
jgi:hypothetical protein